MKTLTRKKGLSLSGNQLKILGAVSMVVDHIGYLFFPGEDIFRVIGRLALPIFAYMIAEGCRYTKNKARYFGGIFLLAVLCQIVYYLAEGSTYMCILVTFAVSILMIYALDNFKAALFRPGCSLARKGLAGGLLLLAAAGSWWLNQILVIDYDFWGCMLPVFVSLFQTTENAPGWLEKLDRRPVHVGMMGLGIVLLAAMTESIRFYSLFALPLLLLYSGERGERNMKYFFYVFYPAHLALLQGICFLVG